MNKSVIMLRKKGIKFGKKRELNTGNMNNLSGEI